MMTGNDIEYIQAYTELNCLLKYFPKEYIKKLPAKLLDLIEKKSINKFKIDIDISKNLEDMQLSKKTYNLLAVLKYNYWSTEEEKLCICNTLKENEISFQNELNEKYNKDNLFKNKTKNIVTDEKQNLSIIKYKENIFNKIFNIIKEIFKHE